VLFTKNTDIFQLKRLGKYVVAKATVAKPGRNLSVVHVDIEDDQGRTAVTGKILYSVGGRVELPPEEIPTAREGSQFTAFGAVPKL
jgi:hypothetical protein